MKISKTKKADYEKFYGIPFVKWWNLKFVNFRFPQCFSSTCCSLLASYIQIHEEITLVLYLNKIEYVCTCTWKNYSLFRTLMEKMFLLKSSRIRCCWLLTLLLNGNSLKNLSPTTFYGNLFSIFWHLTWHSSVNLSGLTTANYTELSHIYEKYKTQGTAICTEQCCVYLSF